MKLRTILIAASVLILGGCANTKEYTLYAQGQASIEQARYAAEAERFKAMAVIASSGDSTAKVAAMFALAMSGGSNGGSGQSTQLKAPEAPGNAALQWASILIPSLTQGYSIYANTKLGMANSNNNARIAESTNNAFVGMANGIATASTASSNSVYQIAQSSNQAMLGIASRIQAPQANVTTTTTTTNNSTSNRSDTSTTTLSGAGVIGNGSFSTQNNPVLSGTGTQGAGSYSPSSTTNPAPVINTPPVVVTPVVVVPAAPASAPGP